MNKSNKKLVSLRLKIILFIILPILITYLSVMIFNIYSIQQWTIENVEQRMTDLAISYANNFDSHLREVAQIARTTAAYIEKNPNLTSENLYNLLHANLEQNSLVYGSAICFEPYKYKKDKKLFVRYVYRDGDNLQEADPSATGYDYTEEKQEYWHTPRNTGKALWTEPYFDEGGGNILMCTYSVPFFKEGNFWGIATIDIPLGPLKELVDIDIADDTPFSVLTEKGTCVYCIYHERINKSAFDRIKKSGRKDLMELAEAIASGKTGVKKLSGWISQQREWVFYAPVKSAKWGFALAMPEKKALASVRAQIRRNIIFLVISLVVVITGLWLLSYKISRPIAQLNLKVSEITNGNLEAKVEIQGHDELGELAEAFNKMSHSLHEREQALNEYEEKFRQLTENINEIFWIGSPDWNEIYYISPAYEQVWGRTCKSLYVNPRSWLNSVFKEDREQVITYIENALSVDSKELKFPEYRITQPDGTINWIQARAFPIYNDKGEVFRIAGIAENITERKQAEEKLRESEEKFRQLVENMNEVFWMENAEGTELLYVSPAYEPIWGRSSQEFYDNPKVWVEAIHPFDRQRVIDAFSKGRNDGTYSEEFRIIRPDGTIRWIFDHSVAIRDKSGSLVRVAGIAEDITERKQTEKKLQKAQEDWKNIFQAIGHPTMILDPDNVILAANNALIKAIGKSEGDILGKKCYELFHNSDEAPEYCPLNKMIESGTLQTSEMEVEALDSTFFVSCTPIFDENGNLQKIIHIATDITEHKKAEKALHEKEETIRAMVETSKDWIWSIDLNGIHTYSNPAIEAILGYKPDELVGTMSINLMHPEDKKIIEEKLPQWIYNKQAWNGQVIRWKHKNGGYRYLESNAVPILDTQGNLCGFRGVDRDITERKEAEEKLQFLSNQNEAILSSVPDIIAEVDAEKRYTWLNHAGQEFFGADAIGRKADYYFEGQQETYEIVQSLFEGSEDVIYVESWQRRKDGQKRLLAWWCRVLKDADGNPAGALSTARDITEQKQAEKALRQSEASLKEAQKIAHIGNWEWNVKTGEVEWSDEIYRIFGLDPENFTPQIDSILALSPPEEQGRGKELIEKAITSHEPGSYEQHFYRPDGTMGIYASTFEGRYDEEGNLFRIVGVAHDITERKKADQERENFLKTLSFKNKELQSIVYIASHDLKSPLVNIQGYSGVLSETCQELRQIVDSETTDSKLKKKIEMLIDEDIPESLNFIIAGSRKMQILLDGLLEVSRIGTANINIKPLNMNEVIKEVSDAMDFQIKESKAKITIDPLPACKGDINMVNQIFSNLLNNALKYLATKRKGKISVSGRQDNNMSIYCVEDNGIGIDTEYHQKIFEIFHRLDPNDGVGGEGLGLTIVTRMLDRLNGRIWLESEQNKGSKFFVSLPKA